MKLNLLKRNSISDIGVSFMKSMTLLSLSLEIVVDENSIANMLIQHKLNFCSKSKDRFRRSVFVIMNMRMRT
jgi:hypothetical protein